jgi:hypothetical protein
LQPIKTIVTDQTAMIKTQAMAIPIVSPRAGRTRL